MKYVGTLNKIAKGFETEGITSGSRYMGYNGQTEFITQLGNGTVVPESEGGGDVLYQTDVDLVQTAIGELGAPIGLYGAGRATYWLAGRYASGYRSNYYYNARYIDQSGTFQETELTTSDEWRVSSFSALLRPIITLKPKIQSISGDGTSGSPWKIN